MIAVFSLLTNVIACGNTENDRSLFEMFQLALAKASPDIQSPDDGVLSQPNRTSLRSLIKDLLDKRIPHHGLRSNRRLFLGNKMDGTPLYLDPFALVDCNSGILGASGSGKSWLAGLLAEGLLKQDYQMCIIDPEGDYLGLQTFSNTKVLSASENQLPSVVDVVTMSEYANVSLVIDLSLYPSAKRAAYVAKLLRALLDLRVRRGRHHWFLVDEAQNFCPPQGGKLTDLILEAMQEGGLSIVSYRPSQISPSILEALDHWLLTRLNLTEEINILKPFLDKNESELKILSQLPKLSIEQAYLYLGDAKQWLPPLEEIVTLNIAQREVTHIRHLHKYLRALLPADKRFYFRDASGRCLGLAAANLWEFCEVLGELPIESLEYHLKRGDFENWLQDVFHDNELVSQGAKNCPPQFDGRVATTSTVGSGN